MAGGPLTIFDKSALQMLSQDEAVWLEWYFQTAITPLFYVETLADLERSTNKPRPGAIIIAELAMKTPSNVAPNVHHKELVASELAGNPLQMDGRPVVGGGELRKTSDGRIGVFFDQFPERAALDRWQRGEFEEIERAVAKDWRRDLAEQNPELKIGILKNIIPADAKLNTLEAIKELADSFCNVNTRANLELMLEMLGVNSQVRGLILKRWEAVGKPPLTRFAPYACHVFKVDLVYYLGIHRGFIAAERASNKADMAYLYYLPFTMVFVSGDKLHYRTAPLFMNSRQSLIKAPELKAALKEMDEFQDKLPEEVKAKGVYAFAAYPPSHMDNLITQLWDKHMRPDWREIQKRKEEGKEVQDVPSDELVEDLMKHINESVPLKPEEMPPQYREDPENMTLRRMMYVQRGKWRMVSKEVEESEGKSRIDFWDDPKEGESKK